MAATATELMDSRTTSTGEKGSHEKRFSIVGSSSETDALVALASASASYYTNAFGTVLYRQTLSVSPVSINTDNEAACVWTGTVQYGPNPTGGGGAPAPESQFSFDTAGGTVHITQSKETLQRVAVGLLPAEIFDQAIGVERDDSGNTTISGTDIVSPQFQFRETHWFTDAEVTQAYKIAISDLTGKINDAAFRGFAAGEVLFLGASGQRDGDDTEDLWSITFSFAVQRNRGDVDVSPNLSLSGPVGGWSYVWAIYGRKEDTAAGTTVSRPTAAYEERVYASGDFSLLGLGVGS